MSVNVIIPDDYQNAAEQIDVLYNDYRFRCYSLKSTANKQEQERLAQADALILIRERTKIDAEFLQKTPKLKLISQTGKLGRNIDLDACTRANVAIVEGIGSPIAPAELTWLLIMASMRKFVPAVNMMRSGYWQTNIGTALNGLRLGILGFGNIGKIVARYAATFGMDVVIWGSQRALNEAQSLNFSIAGSRETFFSTCDIITLHQRLSPETSGNIRCTDLEKMKITSLLVNTSRSELIEKGALLHALKKGRPGFAALDVFEKEPIEIDDPFLQMENVLCSPHIGYVETGSYKIYFKSAFENLVRFFEDKHRHILDMV